MKEYNTDWAAEYNGKHALMIERGYEEVTPTAFYRDLFPEGSLQKKNKDASGKGNIIVTQIRPEKGKRSPQWVVGDDLQNLDKAIGDPFGLIAPVSYYGKSHKKTNAHELFAMVIDIDFVEVRHLKNMLKQFGNGVQLAPTYLVSSGKGVHLYYFLKTPLPMFPDHERIYSELKKAFIRRLWNDTSSQKEDDPDIAGVAQGFRAVGSLSKLGEGYPVRAYRISENKYSLQEIKDAIPGCDMDLNDLQKSTMPLALARLRYPEWYKRRIENKEPKLLQGEYVQHRRLYDWWKRKMLQEVRSGGRYYSIMALCSFGLKCGVPDREIRQDARAFLDVFESRTEDENNHFTAQDIEDALRALKKSNRELTRRATRKWIEENTKVSIPARKRNGLKQGVHLETARQRKAIMKREGLIKEGRKSKAAAVQEWRQKNPEGSKAECRREMGLAWDTIRKHWETTQRPKTQDPKIYDYVLRLGEDGKKDEFLAQVDELQTFIDTLTDDERRTWYNENKDILDEIVLLVDHFENGGG